MNDGRYWMKASVCVTSTKVSLPPSLSLSLSNIFIQYHSIPGIAAQATE